MTKPVRFREVGRILEGWMRSREKEVGRSPLSEDGVGAGVRNVRVGEVQGERRELDENVTGAKRSG